eukprot:gene27066-2299_t
MSTGKIYIRGRQANSEPCTANEAAHALRRFLAQRGIPSDYAANLRSVLESLSGTGDGSSDGLELTAASGEAHDDGAIVPSSSKRGRDEDEKAVEVAVKKEKKSDNNPSGRSGSDAPSTAGKKKSSSKEEKLKEKKKKLKEK